MEGSTMRSIAETAGAETEAGILPKLAKLFRSVFDGQAVVLRLETTATDIAGWDSMLQVRPAGETEHRFGVTIKFAKIEAMASVRGLLARIGERPTMAAV
jgi:acyl carrier protein